MLEAVLRHARAGAAPLHVPGHKGGKGLDPELAAWLGTAARLDLTELDGLDSLHAPLGPIAAAQDLAARLWGADETFFLVGGSTVGVQAAILAACQPGDAVILPRSAHMSALGGLILAGAQPIYMPSVRMAGGFWGMPDVETFAAALARHRPKLALLTRPGYEGGLYDLAPYVAHAHAAGVTLLVDEAHGAHLGLHPRLPASALAQGADAAVQSTHKLLSALTPGAMLHVRGQRLDPGRLRRALNLLQTTSPSYLVLASLDAARRQAATMASRDWDALLDMLAASRARLAKLPGLKLLEGDPLKLALDVAGAGLDGYAAADRLAEHGVIVEHATPRHVVAFAGPGTRPEDLARLEAACATFACHAAAVPADPDMPPLPPAVLAPREAFFAGSRPVPWGQALGAVAAEPVCPYPPGAPALVPGERITAEVVEYLDGLRALGAQLVGPVDPSLSTIRIMV